MELSYNHQGEFSKLLFIETYGCQMNVADSEVVASVMKMAGYDTTESIDDADAIFINTCSIRDNAEQKIFSRLNQINALRRRRPRRLIVGIIGCMAERLKEVLINDYDVDIVAGPDSYLELPNLTAAAEAGEKAIDTTLSTTETYRDIIPHRISGNKVSGYISIMRGCNNFCTYCIVPYTRGRERSREPQSILNELRDLQSKGFKEVILLGQNVNSYLYKPADGSAPVDMATLLAIVAEAAPEMRVRFTTSNPEDLSDEIIATMAAHPNICNHIHLPVQSGSNHMLAEMNRKYNVSEYLSLIEYAKKKIPDMTFSSDIIVGFPGETEADFEQTMDLVQKVGYTQLFTFIYSKRSGTKAATLPDDTPYVVKTDRIARLLALHEQFAVGYAQSLIGKRFRVLVDGAGKRPGSFSGRLENNLVVDFTAPCDLTGQFAWVKVTGNKGILLLGELDSLA